MLVDQGRVDVAIRDDAIAPPLVLPAAAEAVTLLQDTVRDYPDSDWAWYLLGKALNQQHNWLAAEQALRRAAQLTPAAAEIQFPSTMAIGQETVVANALETRR